MTKLLVKVFRLYFNDLRDFFISLKAMNMFPNKIKELEN